jgi:hypothetical protein
MEATLAPNAWKGTLRQEARFRLYCRVYATFALGEIVEQSAAALRKGEKLWAKRLQRAGTGECINSLYENFTSVK